MQKRFCCVRPPCYVRGQPQERLATELKNLDVDGELGGDRGGSKQAKFDELQRSGTTMTRNNGNVLAS